MTDIAHLILDFDGTCTQIPKIWQAYLDYYLKGLSQAGFSITDGEWIKAGATVREHSPKAGWTLAGCPAAPAAADPYILADESARLILRQRRDHRPVPSTINADAYKAATAPWRVEAGETFTRLVERGIKLHFVSNSSTVVITERVKELVKDHPALEGKIAVQSDAGKFRIGELAWENTSPFSPGAAAKFESLPVAWNANPIGRPIYLRRGSYFEAINRVLSGNLELLERTVFCGDIWEMDLAMPYALGANIHLIDRAPPFETYPYERRAVANAGARAKASPDLTGLLNWI